VIEVLEAGAPGAPPMEDRPLPLADHVSATYWEAAARGELLYQECAGCGHRQFYPRAMCTNCAGDTEWKQASGRGIIHTYTVIRQNWAMPFRELQPYVVAMIELEEGPRMMTNVTDVAIEDVRVGLPVECYVVKVEDGLGLPFWRPATNEEGAD
jgi:uncharacterized OB-fold protein